LVISIKIHIKPVKKVLAFTIRTLYFAITQQTPTNSYNYNMKNKSFILISLSILTITSCDLDKNTCEITNSLVSNSLNYQAAPDSAYHRNSLVFSDQGAWFAYSLAAKPENYGGFIGPFLMSQENGIWSSQQLTKLELKDLQTGQIINWADFNSRQLSFNSHLEQIYENNKLRITQRLFYTSAHSVLINTQIDNISERSIEIEANWSGDTFMKGLKFKEGFNSIELEFSKTNLKGRIQTFESPITKIYTDDDAYEIVLNRFEIGANESKQLTVAHTFILQEYNRDEEQKTIEILVKNPLQKLQSRILEKEKQIETLNKKLGSNWNDSIYKDLLSKTVLSLQNNWRIPTGELKHAGLFPSYHYKWFHGFWAWDSWKHAVALAHYNPILAKDQIKAMYDYQCADGFIPDCIFRDTDIEKHNYRNTKPPLSAWATWEVYKQCEDLNFLAELYPKITKQHNWWYINRDHDGDGLCEYGSTDGSLIAAKWESGMDNAVRFDKSIILKNSESAYSLNQESVDLNAYLFAEKKFLRLIAQKLQLNNDVEELARQEYKLKVKFQHQFFDANSGWFYDTSLDGDTFILSMACEGWIPLWSGIASTKQAEQVRNNMMNQKYFNLKMPLQTLSASHPDFEPDRGYWRGPNWLDQSYFGISGLANYGYKQEANDLSCKLIHNAEGLLTKGPSIRENYHPVTGKGLEAKNFSWSAAHYLLLLLENN